jgi:hypothetical protein
MSSDLLNQHCIHEHTIILTQVDNTLAINSNTHNNDISANTRQLRCHKGNALIGRKMEVAFEEDSEDMNPRPSYDSDITIVNVRLRISAIKNAFDNRKVSGTSVHPSCGSCHDIDHPGTQLCGRIKSPCAVTVGCLEENR